MNGPIAGDEVFVVSITVNGDRRLEGLFLSTEGAERRVKGLLSAGCEHVTVEIWRLEE